MALDLTSKKATVVFEDNFDGEVIQPLMGKTVILGRRVRGNESGQWIEHIVSMRLDNAASDRLFELPIGASFAVSPDGQSIFVYGPKDSLRAYDVKSNRFRDISDHDLPGKNGAQGACFIGNSDVVLFRENDTKLPIGYYRMNINSGRGEFVSRESIWHPRYMKERPE